MKNIASPTAISKCDSVDRWLDFLCSSLHQVQTQPLGDAPFSGRISTETFGAVKIRHFQSTPVRYLRGDREINRNPTDMFGASLTLTGRAVISQDGKEVVQGPGDIVLFDTGRPFEYVLPEGDDQFVVDIPGALLQQELPNAHQFTCTVLSGQSVFGRLFGGLLKDLDGAQSGIHAGTSGRLGSTIVDLLATALAVELGDLPIPKVERPSVYEKVKAYILDHLADPDLNVDTIAFANHISVRSLHRLFAANGTTVIRWLWNQRLVASYKALSVGKSTRVSDVALMYGFTNFSHFTRAFKQAFRVLPQDVLRSGR
jgi:AraC family transcriptional regulator, positive regulator of tynA and feaB